MSNQSDYLNSRAFAWFTGVVEDILDPEELGRVRVRCFGYHSANKQDIPTETLPWAWCMTPVTSAAISQIGVSATGIKQGTWVVGFFRDGPSAQDPLVIGTLPTVAASEIDTTKGFCDPAGVHPVNAGLADIPAEATSGYKETATYQHKESVAAAAQNIPTVSGSWSLPTPADTTAPVYPQNSATVSDAGHVSEVDDTHEKPRLLQLHGSGTYREVIHTGDEITVVVGDRYTLLLQNDRISVAGNATLTVNGNLETLVGGDYKLKVAGDYSAEVSGSSTTAIGGSQTVEAGGTMTLTASTIDLNP